MRAVVRIPTGGAGLSDPVKIRGYKVAGIQMPPAWQAATLTFRGLSVETPGRTQVVPNGTVAGLAVDANAFDIQMTNDVTLQVIGAPHVTPTKVDPIDISDLLSAAATIDTSKHGIMWVFQNPGGTVDVETDKSTAAHTSAIIAWAQYSKPSRTLPPAFGMVPIGAVHVLEGGSGSFAWGTDSITAETEAYHDFAGLPEVLIRAASLVLDSGAATFTYGAVTIRLGSGTRVAATGKPNVVIAGSNVAAGKTGAWLIYVLADDVEYALPLGNAYANLADAQAAVANHIKNPMLALIGAMYVVNNTVSNFIPGTTFLNASDIDTTFETFGPTHLNVQDDAGNELSLTAAADEYLVLDQGSKEKLGAMAEIQVRSGTSATPVDQTSSPDLTLVLEPTR